MSPEVTKIWQDELSRCLYERDRFKRLAANMRKLAAQQKQSRDFVGSLRSASCARAYRDTYIFYAEGVLKAKAMLAKG